MTDEQLDGLEREAKLTYEWEQKPDGYMGRCQGRIYHDDLLALIADYRRLRELERAVGAIRAEYKSEVWQALEQVYALRKKEQALHDERTHLMSAYVQAWREGYRKGKADHLQELEVAVRGAIHPLTMGRGWVWRGDAADIAAIGRLLEGER